MLTPLPVYFFSFHTAFQFSLLSTLHTLYGDDSLPLPMMPTFLPNDHGSCGWYVWLQCGLQSGKRNLVSFCSVDCSEG